MKTIVHVLMVVLISFFFFSCAQKMSFQSSPAVPAASGFVKFKKDKNKNYSITVKVKNLEQASKLMPPGNVYVVWMESSGVRRKNIGQIVTSSGLLSKKYKGELTAISTTKPTRVYITAEDDGNTQYPGSVVVLTTD